MNYFTDLNTYSFTQADIDLITFAVRRLCETSSFITIKADSQNLLEHIERMKIEKGMYVNPDPNNYEGEKAELKMQNNQLR